MRKAGTFSENPIEYSLFGLLYKSPRYGYELFQSLRVKSGLGLIWTVKQAQLYSILAKFESKGLLSVAIDDSGSTVRKMYRLLPKGRDIFVEWVKTPSPRRDFRLEFLAKLYFLRVYFPKSELRLIREQMALCSSWLAEMRARATPADPSTTDFLVYRYRISQLESMLEWLKECEDSRSSVGRGAIKASQGA